MTMPERHAGCATAHSWCGLRHFNESCAFVIRPSVTARSSTRGHRCPRVVGVITSPTEFDFAIRMNEPPDLFELRLDRLLRAIDRLENKISKLRAPVVITARHPMEGGANRLSSLQRHNLLARFLSRARYIDVELRSAPVFVSLLQLARRRNVRRIISVHHLKNTPSPSRLRAQARAAKTYGADFFKVATRTDTPMQLIRLIDFAVGSEIDIAVSAMGIGKLGAASRMLLACCGSALVYVSLGRSDIEGQMSLDQVRALTFAALKR
jgi:3-dehydroquinate dehydratase I